MQYWKGSGAVSGVQNWGFGDRALKKSTVRDCLRADCLVCGVDQDISELIDGTGQGMVVRCGCQLGSGT